MKCFLFEHRARRTGYDGWALRFKGWDAPIAWTVCTTREEARELRRERGNLLHDTEIVKVRISVEAIGQ